MADSTDTPSSRSLRSEMRTQISEFDARISALETSLAAARCERKKLQSRLSDYKYPVLTLPVEITAEIFINFLPAYPERPLFSGLFSPELFLQVCRNWREISLDTPRLWSVIYIYLYKGCSLDGRLNLLATWLLRSKNCPLSLSFEIEAGFTFPELPHFTAALISHSERTYQINHPFR
ncbi:hypothetical protein C8J57DRAFT_1073380 [Mycena rebaudengoi]|nr:hypothetical protein C8J57DRAFT_1073380 [Mycena rebaudengoi]